MVLWAGQVEGSVCRVVQALFPRQTTWKTNAGLCVEVDGNELFNVNRALYSARQVLVAQVHTHPTEAFHSQTDDRYCIATTAGALSIVVPSFGRFGLFGPGVKAYRLHAGAWRLLSAPLASIVEVEPWH
jgi:hypothetical protein